MIHFEEAIVDLLLRHNCVIVPSFGGFVAQSTNAIVDFRNGTMFPPRKSVLFNKQLINNDGLLLHYLSEKNKWQFDIAQEKVTETIQIWNENLKSGQRVIIDKIGYLYLDSERNISFEQDRFFNLLLQSYGLNKVHFLVDEDIKRIEAENQPSKTIAPVIENVVPSSDPIIELEPTIVSLAKEVPPSAAKVIPLNEEHNSPRKAWKYIAAAALLPFAFYTYWLPMKTNVLESGVLSLNDFNPSYKAGEGVYQKKGFSFSLKKRMEDPSFNELVADLPKDVKVYFYKFAEDLYIPVRLRESKPKAKKILVSNSVPIVNSSPVAALDETPAPKKDELVEVPKPKVSEPTTTDKPKTARIIMNYVVGGFTTQENAALLVEELKTKGFKATILPVEDGKYRVSAGATTSNTEMAQIEARAKNKGVAGWVLK